MLVIKFFLSISLLFIFNIFSLQAQELTCKDFKSGVFVASSHLVDSLEFHIIRFGNSQSEIINDPEKKLSSGFGKIFYEKIEWIDYCTYRLKYDETKMELGEFEQFINDNNGILTEMIKIENQCYYYKSTLVVEGESQSLDGKICLD